MKEGLQSFADRTLRYEITFRKSYMSSLFKMRLFAKNCPYYKAMRKTYDEANVVKKKCERELEKARKIKHITDDQKTLYMTAFIRLPKEKKDAYHQYKAILDKRNKFCLEISKQDRKENTTIEGIYFKANYNPSIPINALFSRELLHEMFRVFISFMDEFELKNLDKYEDNIQKVILYNREVDRYNKTLEDQGERKSKINESLANQILFNLQYHTLDEMVQLKLISRRTKYNYLKILDKISINKNTVIQDEISVENKRDFVLYQNQIGLVF